MPRDKHTTQISRKPNGRKYKHNLWKLLSSFILKRCNTLSTTTTFKLSDKPNYFPLMLAALEPVHITTGSMKSVCNFSLSSLTMKMDTVERHFLNLLLIGWIHKDISLFWHFKVLICLVIFTLPSQLQQLYYKTSVRQKDKTINNKEYWRGGWS